MDYGPLPWYSFGPVQRPPKLFVVAVPVAWVDGPLHRPQLWALLKLGLKF